jgi:2-methylcitrate dehydratase PrpD
MQAAPQSTIALHGTRTTAPYAAFVNGAFATSCEFDDCHMCAWHIGSFIVPAAMAVGESINASGRQVIEAIIAGAQVMAVLGCSIRDTMIRQGWHGAKILGTFGAVAAAGKLLGLTSIQMANAFGIAGSDAGGTMEYDVSGGEVKRMHAGSSGRLGTQAALLAQLGLTGPLTIFEGSRGLFRMFGQTDDLSSVDREWSKFHIVDTIFRPYPVIGSACAPLDAVRALQHQHDFDWRDVTRIDLGLLPFALGHGASIVEPTDAVSASFVQPSASRFGWCAGPTNLSTIWIRPTGRTPTCSRSHGRLFHIRQNTLRVRPC